MLDNFVIAHHDDIIVFSKSTREHKMHLQLLFQALSRNGLRISPQKCKLYQRKVNYMGHCIFVNEQNKLCVTTQANRCEAIRKMARPHTGNPKSARRFVGAINYVAQFFPGIQGIMKPLHQLARKNKRFQWSEEHEQTFEKVKELLVTPAVLYIPQGQGRLTLYSDTSRKATGS